MVVHVQQTAPYVGKTKKTHGIYGQCVLFLVTRELRLERKLIKAHL